MKRSRHVSAHMQPFVVAMVAGAALEQAAPKMRAVVSDVDGTLFSFAGRRISPGNAAALSECVEAGVHVCLATGRLPGPWYDDIRAELPGLGPCVFGNGALVLDEQDSVLYEAQLPRDVVHRVLRLTSGGMLSGGGRLSVLAATRYAGEEASYGGLRYCELAPTGPTHITSLIAGAGEPDAVVLPSLDGFEDRQVIKFVIWTTPGEDGWADMPSTVEALRVALAGTGVTLLDHGAKWCEVLPAGVNKGAGVARVLDRLGVPAADMLALGDAENDVEMLAMAGVGAAVANAQPAAIEAADVTVGSNAEDGVAQAVRRYVWGDA